MIGILSHNTIISSLQYRSSKVMEKAVLHTVDKASSAPVPNGSLWGLIKAPDLIPDPQSGFDISTMKITVNSAQSGRCDVQGHFLFCRTKFLCFFCAILKEINPPHTQTPVMARHVRAASFPSKIHLKQELRLSCCIREREFKLPILPSHFGLHC